MEHEFDYFDEYPQDDPFIEVDDLKYKDNVAESLVELMHEYLSFSTTKDLLKLLAANL